MFHVKHSLLPDTEIPENRVQDLVYIHSPGDAPERTCSQPDILCGKLG